VEAGFLKGSFSNKISNRDVEDKVIPIQGSGAVTEYPAPAQRSNPEHDPEKWMPVFRKDHAPPNI
jgi:hypothetical protein